MAWTWRRTGTGLALTLFLGLSSSIVFVLGEQRRSEIIGHGQRAEAVVSADHDSEFGHWYTVSYTAQGGAREADLRYPWLIDQWPVGRVLTVYVDPADPENIATQDGYATPRWTEAPGMLAVLALLAAFITAVGHLTRRRKAGPGTP